MCVGDSSACGASANLSASCIGVVSLCDYDAKSRCRQAHLLPCLHRLFTSDLRSYTTVASLGLLSTSATVRARDIRILICDTHRREDDLKRSSSLFYFAGHSVSRWRCGRIICDSMRRRIALLRPATTVRIHLFFLEGRGIDKKIRLPFLITLLYISKVY